MKLQGVILAVALAAASGRTASAAAPTAQDFARLPAVASVSIAPDGRHIAAITSPDGQQTFVTIWKTDAPAEKPVVLGLGASSVRAVQQRYMSVSFVKNDRISVTLRQLATDNNPDQKHFFRFLLTDVDGKGKWETSLGEQNPDGVSHPIVSNLPKDPKNVLTSGGEGDVYKVDIYAGTNQLAIHGSDKFSYQIDHLNGDLRGKQAVGFDNGAMFGAQFLKHPDTGSFDEHFRWYAKDRVAEEAIAFEPDPNLVFVRSSRGRDKAAIYEYDIRAKKMGEPAFASPFFEAEGVVQSRGAADYGQVLGFTYNAETTKTYWIDDRLAKLQSAVSDALGARTVQVDWTDADTGKSVKLAVVDGFSVEIAGWSDDRSRVILVKSGPKAPPEYYLYEDGKPLRLLARSMPQIDTAALGDARLVQYAARDGLIIPAFVTTPPASFGSGPHPAIVLPHGGPWARDEMGWDATGWTQFFAARGYVVIQPQFRGSMGWGQKLWRAGDREWGQKMQDDNDDAAKWLIAQRLADPKRIAIFGYSYGGYAALAGAIRPNGLYQCAVSGAGGADLKYFQALTGDSRWLREFQRPSVDGLDLFAHAGEVSIPVLLIHGDSDVTVPTSESRRMDRALGAKPHRLVLSKDMGHQISTWQPKDIELMLVETEKFLASDCKPGGL